MDLVDLWVDFFETYYKDEVNKLAMKYKEGKYLSHSLVVDWQDLYKFRDGILARELEKDPDKTLAMASVGLSKVNNVYDVELKNVAVRIANPPTIKKKTPKELTGIDVDKFIAVEGSVIAVSEISHVICTAKYVCPNCGSTFERNYAFFERLPKSIKCPRCKEIARLDLSKSEIRDYQFGKLLDFPEKLKPREQPTILEIVLDEGLLGQLRLGERVCLTGILRVKSKGHLDYRRYFEVNWIHKYDKLGIKLTKEDIEKIKAFAKQGNVLERLSKCIAPSLVGLDDIKKAIVLQMVGGNEVVRKDGTVRRGNIHILLIGNPLTGKSELLRSVKKLAPRAVYFVKTKENQIGLTATIERDKNTGRRIIVAGAVVIGSDGITCIDEFEELDSKDIEALNEVLEQQTVTVTLFGSNTTLNAKTAILASAKPKRGFFNKYGSIWNQISIPSSTLSRFDLVFIIWGNYSNEVIDHVLDTAEKKEIYDIEITPEFFTKYIMYAREIRIKDISPEAKKVLAEFYESVKSAGKSVGGRSITLRQFMALIRLSEASAKLRLSEVVDKCDANVAIELMKKSLKSICLAPKLSVYDVTTLKFRAPKSERDKIEIIKMLIAKLEDEYGAADEQMLYDLAESEYSISRGKVQKIISRLMENGEIYMPRYGQYRLVRS